MVKPIFFCHLARFIALARAPPKSNWDRPGRNISAVRHQPVEPMSIRR